MIDTDTFHLFGNLIKFHARGDAGYCLVTVTTAPGAGVPPNSHPDDDEVFCVLEGKYAFQIDGTERIAEAGDVVAIPNGAVHALRNAGDKVARMFVFNTPGKIHTRFFSEIGEPMPRGATDFPAPSQTPPDVPALIKRAEAIGVAIRH